MNREQLEEELTCTCGAGHGSMEGHMPWCDWTESNVAVEPTMTREQKLEEALRRLVDLNDNHGPFGGEMYQDRIDRTWDAARAALSAPKAEAKKNIGTIAHVDHGKTSLTAIAISLLAARGAEAEEPCPVCAKPFAAGDTCATDIELGKCHAECLADSPTVDLKTGEPMDGPISTFTHAAPKAEAVTVKPLAWAEQLRRGERDGFVFSLGGIISYSIMLSRFRVYGIPGAYDGASEYNSLEEAKAAAQADYEARILSAIDTSPAPALTDEAVERAAKAIHDGPLGANDEEDFGDNKASEWCREVARAALLAAFPSKGEGE